MTKTLDVGPFQNGKATYKLRVSEADAEMGMYRTMLQEEAILAENIQVTDSKELDLRAASRRILHTIMYPAMIAASEPLSGFKDWPISFDEYRKLPEPLIIAWEQAVFTLNAHWQPRAEPTPAEIEDQEKKVPSSSPES